MVIWVVEGLVGDFCVERHEGSQILYSGIEGVVVVWRGTSFSGGRIVSV